MPAEARAWARVVDASALGAILFGERALGLDLVTLDARLARAVAQQSLEGHEG